jgi:M6 family metalloprotease-like protein
MIVSKPRFKIFLFVAVLSLYLMTSNAKANIASPFPVDLKQPDGTKITLYLRGTEELNWYEYVPEIRSVNRAVLDTPQGLPIGRNPGYTVIKDANGRYVFADRAANGDWTSTAAVVGRDQPPAGTPRRLLPSIARLREMAQARMPKTAESPQRVSSSGDVSNLVILMRFKNHRQRTLPTAQQFDVIFNKAGGDPVLAPTGSVFDVYNENSYAKLRLRSKVVGWVDLPKTEQDYAAGNSGLGVNIHEAIVDALKGVVAGNLANFKDFDNEGGVGDGRIDAITFVHSGYAAEFGGADADGTDLKSRIWSHRWSIPEWSGNPAGVKVSDYNINPGLWSTSGKEPGRIGVICHELGHFFGLPDLYDYSGAGEGAGSWCLMANSWGFDGSQLHPPHFSAWSKIFLGWNHASTLTTPGTYSAKATSLPGAEIYRVNFAGTPASEYLLIENRQPIGNFDGGIEAGSDGVKGGLAIWHIDDSKSANDEPGFPGQAGWPANGKHYWVGLLQADGAYGLEQGVNRGDGNDVFRAGFKDSLTASTLPSSSSFGGATIPAITAISSSASTMSFKFGETGGGGGGTGESSDCCAQVFDALVNYGTTVSGNAKITSVTIDLTQDSIVHLTANGSVQTDQESAILVTNGFYNEDVPADPATDQMWIQSLRFVTLAPKDWTNFGSTAAISLPKGSHTIYWKVSVTSATLKFDFGTLLVEAYPQKGPAPSTSQGRMAGLKTMKSSDRSALSKSAGTSDVKPQLCSSETFDALLALIETTKDSPGLRREAIKVASDLARFDKKGCEKLGRTLSKVISNMEDDADVRRAAIDATKSLVQ